MGKLFLGEKLIGEWLGSELFLTNIRLIRKQVTTNASYVQSIMLDQISYIGIQFKQKTLYLILAILTGLFALYQLLTSFRSSDSIGFVIVLGMIVGVFVVLYINSRNTFLIIASSGGSIEIGIGSDFNKAQEIREVIEATRYETFFKDVILENTKTSIEKSNEK